MVAEENTAKLKLRRALEQLDQNDLEGLLRDAQEELERNDSNLLLEGVLEVAIAHQLACYLKPRFYGYSMDIEYDRQGRNPKRVGALDKRIRPDIVIHERSTNDHNLLVVECKKSSSRAGSSDDKKKLAALKRAPFKYARAVFVRIPVGKNLECRPTFTWV